MNFSALFLAAQIALAAQLPLAAQAAPASKQAPKPAPITGFWEGVVRLPGAELPFQVNLAQANEKELLGHISIPSQGLNDYKLEEVAFSRPDISFRLPGIPGNPTIAGRLEGEAIKGELSQGGAKFPIELKRSGDPKAIAVIALTKGLSEREVTVGKGDWELPGTLTLPAGKGPFPAAILVHGSGPNSRDGIFDIYKELAWNLAEKGIAVLRYDKRTLVHGAKFPATYTLNEVTADDAALAVEAASQAKEINAGKIFVIGHSKGGYALGRIAEKSSKAAGFVSLAGSARPMEVLIAEQAVYLGWPEAEVKKINDALAKIQSKDYDADTPAGELYGLRPSWLLDLQDYDPVASLRRAKRPALIIQGEADYQVTMKDFGLWKEGFPEATHKSFPKLDHLFKHVEGKSTPAEYAKPGRKISPEVIQAISDWIIAQARGKE
jgi:fermentation-respiration switch protein FrsA (DUF1100 family)